MLKKILLALIFVITAITGVTYAEDDMKTVASKAYVDTQIETKQLKIPAAGQPNVDAGETVMTYTATGNGQIGERGLYSDISSYDATTDGDKLITASALNATFTNLPTTGTTKLECANESDGCTLWTIVDQTAYGNGLPSGYTRLEYIESTGTQYIDTGLTNAPNTTSIRVISDVAFLEYPTGTGSAIFYLSRPNAGLQVYLNAHSLYNQGVAKWVYLNIFYNVDTMTTATSRSIALNGGEPAKQYFSRSITDGDPIYVFGNGFKAKLRSQKFYINGSLVRNFVPAKNSNNVIGLYDTVSGQFFTNSGTGDFVPGPAVN